MASRRVMPLRRHVARPRRRACCTHCTLAASSRQLHVPAVSTPRPDPTTAACPHALSCHAMSCCSPLRPERALLPLARFVPRCLGLARGRCGCMAYVCMYVGGFAVVCVGRSGCCRCFSCRASPLRLAGRAEGVERGFRTRREWCGYFWWRWWSCCCCCCCCCCCW
ncbi:uncharacterized protein K452DRAFT_358261 [Aplosporella prunicola CBS 121167]|uniref:Uncharacterized protein n=1 Tax=Aplosporella prunicola CBS 121167 TaxID=1176127 RepID=A0A6A6BGU1_9PEZI|nr:uncharacterized protein K452DRAFT_358261 [Aplosporella prunicola CBS 121167]KAF2142494.1 hypothetical protein K452DRAFT_358261 [Aplosporella prunicola CBS 121167]